MMESKEIKKLNERQRTAKVVKVGSPSWTQTNNLAVNSRDKKVRQISRLKARHGSKT